MVEITIRELLKDATDNIKINDFNNPLLDAQLIMAHVLEKDRLYVLTHLDDNISLSQAECFNKLIDERKNGKPLQYITGSQEFMGLNFHVKEGVLIPRADTECLVEKIIEIIEKEFTHDSRIRILDIGSGSGAIGCSLAYYMPNVEIIGIDISEIAVELSNINCDRLKIKNYKVFKRNIFDDIFLDLNKFDLVVSNPPYIPKEEIDSLQVEVSEYEPRLALDGGYSGLNYYERIIDIFCLLVKEKGILVFEHGVNQSEKIYELMNQIKGMNKIEVINDLAGRKRGLIGYYNSLRGENNVK